MKKNDVHLHSCRIKLLIFMLIGCWLAGSVQAANDEPYRSKSVSLEVNNMELSQVLDMLSKTADVRFFYNHSQLNLRQKVSLHMINRPFDEVLKAVLKNQNVDIEYQPDRIVVLTLRQTKAGTSTRKVSGIILDDETGEPLPGATIRMKEITNMGVVSDAQGKFLLEVPKGVTTLIISFIGYDEVQLLSKEFSENMIIRMKPIIVSMEDVVVTGMAPRKVEGFTGDYVTVKAEQLKTLNPNNLLSALQIFDPSFRIVENNRYGSDPNRLPEFRLRGDVQLGSVEVDDMTLMMGDYSNRPNMPLFILDGFETTLQKIVDMDPERVESITILKDAAATAIYGSRAANGVIVFETKQPRTGAINISYSMNMGLTAPDLTDYNLMNAEEKLEYERKAGIFKEDNADHMNYYNHYKREILEGVNTYWLSAPLRTVVTHRHNLTMEGGDKTLRYSLSVNYNSSPGVMKKSDRNTLGMNLNLQYRRKKWNIGNRLSLSNTKGNNSPYGSFGQYTKLNPYYRKTDVNGQYQDIIENKSLAPGTSAIIKNPLYNTQFPFKDLTENFSITDNFSIECAVLENLRINAQASLSKGTSLSEKFKSMNHTDFATTLDMTKKGSYDKSTGNTLSWSVNASVNYNLSVKKHLLSVYARWDVRENQNDAVSMSAVGFPNDNMTDFLFAYEINKRIGGSESTSRSLGVIGQLSYMYDYRYAFDFSVRGDLSSQFGADTHMAPFWSVGLRWNAHKEKWLAPSGISSLVVRGSYGITGSQNYAPYQAIETYSFENLMFPYPASDVLGAELKGVGNPELGWSKTKNRSAAIEIGYLENRINASFSYYNNYTDQMLLAYTLPPSVGFRSMTRNVGGVVNKGYDIQISGMPIRDYKNKIQWNISLNATHNKNEIKKISNVLRQMNKKNLESTGAPLPIYEEGRSTTQLFTVTSLGIDPATGKEVFLKRNGEKTFVWDASDKIPWGDSQPKVNGAVSSSFNYKGVSINLGFAYQWGAYRYNSTLVDKIENSSLLYNVDKRALTERWTPENRNAKFKAISAFSENTPQSSRFMQKFNEFKFSSIALGYRFDPKRHRFLQACHVASLSMNFSMQDIARIATVKEERGLDYPFARSFNFSLSVMFN